MSNYIFLTPNITDIGGAQIYLKNKTEWLLSQKFNVIIISYIKEKISIEQFNVYKKNIIGELAWPPHWYYKKKKQWIINRLIKIIGNINGESIIESNTPDLAVWGEIIAQKLKAKHIVYSLTENNDVEIGEICSFLNFKLNRRELAGIKKKAFIDILKKNCEKIPELKAHLNNVPKDFVHEIIGKIKPADYTLASIGRIDKPFVLPIIKEIVKFAFVNKDMSFNLILIGGTRNKQQLKLIKKTTQYANNLNLIVTGFIYPIPLDLIRIPDVFISSAGSCRVSASYNKLTISIDSKDHQPIGIFGITTQNTIYRENEVTKDLCELLEDILLKKKYDNTYIYTERALLQADYSDHMRFIDNSMVNKDYFTFEYQLRNRLLKKLIINTLGSHTLKLVKLIKYLSAIVH